MLNTRTIRNDNTHLIKIRITQNRKTWYYPISKYLELKYWCDKKCRAKRNYSNNKLINHHINNNLVLVEKLLLQLESSNPKYTLLDIKEILKPSKSNAADVFSFFDKLIEEQYRVRRVGNANIYKQAVDKIRQQVNFQFIQFKDITYKFLTT